MGQFLSKMGKGSAGVATIVALLIVGAAGWGGELGCRTGAPPAPTEPAVVPSAVALTVRGAPPATRVLLDGETLGEAPGPVSLPFSEAPLRLTFTAPAFESMTLILVPNRPLMVTANLKKASPSH